MNVYEKVTELFGPYNTIHILNGPIEVPVLYSSGNLGAVNEVSVYASADEIIFDRVELKNGQRVSVYANASELYIVSITEMPNNTIFAASGKYNNSDDYNKGLTIFVPSEELVV